MAEENVVIDLKRLFPHTIPTNPDGRNMFFIGPHRSGKTTTLEYLIFCRHQYYKESFGLVLAGSVDSVERISQFYPECFITRSYNRARLRKFYDDVKRTNEAHRAGGRKDRMIPFFLILDDTGFDPKVWTDPTLKEVLMNGRHYRLDCYMCVQYVKTLKPEMRSQADYIFLHRDPSPQNHRKMFEVFASSFFPHFRGFQDVFSRLTRQFWSIVIRYADQDSSPEADPFDEGVRKCKAHNPEKETLPRFRIGHPDIWKFARRLEKKRQRQSKARRLPLGEKVGTSDILNSCNPRTRVRVREI
jgi:hypothetical protein